MLTIRTTLGTYFDLIPCTKLSIEETSPMFSDVGSFSLPLELPPTDNNLQILEYPHRADRRKKFITSLDVIIECGVWIRHARMDVETVGKNKSITTSLFFRESPFYEKMKGKRLPEMFSEDVKDYFSNQPTLDAKLNEWWRYLNEVMCGDTTDHFFVFPVCAKIEEKEETTDLNGISLKKAWKRHVILNRQTVPDKDIPGIIKHTTGGRAYYALTHEEIDYSENGEVVRLPKGYGWTAFMKFNYIIQQVFTKLGYEFNGTVMHQDPFFLKLCFINNTADAFVRGYLSVSQLLPDIEIVDLLKMMENTFGCAFVIDEVSKTITARFWKDVLKAYSMGNASRIFDEFPIVSFSTKKSIHLKIERQVAESTPIEFDAFPAMFKKYGTFQRSSKSIQSLKIEAQQGNIAEGVYFLRNSRAYCAVYKDHYSTSEPALWRWEFKFIERNSADYFDADVQGEVDERACGFMHIPLSNIALRGYTDKRQSITITHATAFTALYEHYFNSMMAQFVPDDGMIGSIPHIDSLRHMNSAIQVTSTSGGNTSVEVKAESEVKLPVLLGFSHGFSASTTPYPDLNKTFFGSQDAYDNDGNEKGSFDLSTLDLYKKFWKEYDDLLQSSFHEISGQATMDVKTVMQLRFDAPLTLNNQKVLPESIQYELSDEGVEVIDFKAKLIKKYE